MRAGAIVVLISILVMALMAWEDLAVPQVSGSSCTTWMCDLYVALRDFQTLVGGGLALVAAWLAARPAWLQLQSINLQQEIAARRTIADRLTSIESRMTNPTSKLNAFSMEIAREILPYEEADYEPSSVNVHWAFDKGHDAQNLLTRLETDQALRHDTDRIETYRSRVIVHLEALRVCLYDITATAQYSGDPDLSAEQEEALPFDEERARQQLPDIYASFVGAARAFEAAGLDEIQRFRARLRSIDDRLLD